MAWAKAWAKAPYGAYVASAAAAKAARVPIISYVAHTDDTRGHLQSL